MIGVSGQTTKRKGLDYASQNSLKGKSGMSSYVRKKEAKEALEQFVLREEIGMDLGDQFDLNNLTHYTQIISENKTQLTNKDCKTDGTP